MYRFRVKSLSEDGILGDIVPKCQRGDEAEVFLMGIYLIFSRPYGTLWLEQAMNCLPISS